MSTGEEVAIKLESVRSKHPQLLYESKIYRVMAGVVGIPSVRWFGTEVVVVIVVVVIGNKGRLQRDGDRPAWQEPRGPVQRLRPEVLAQDGADPGRPVAVSPGEQPQPRREEPHGESQVHKRHLILLLLSIFLILLFLIVIIVIVFIIFVNYYYPFVVIMLRNTEQPLTCESSYSVSFYYYCHYYYCLLLLLSSTLYL